MTHYEERLEQDLSAIRKRIADVAARIDEAVGRSVRATIKGDRPLANDVILGDKPINREIRAIDKLCHGFIARHLPSGGHLRFVSTVLRLNLELERIGDYAVAVAREAVQLSTVPSGPVTSDIQLISDQALLMFRQAMQSFNDRNAELARGTQGMASQVASTYQKVFTDLLEEGDRGARPIKDLFATLVVFNRIGRVADQAKNICEDTLFVVAGETKGEKVYRILFLDERNDGLSRLAESYARKVFPGSGVFESAGWAAADSLIPTLRDFMDARGLEPGENGPTRLDHTLEELSAYQIIVALGSGASSHVSQTPFHTVLLEWDVEPIPADLDPERTAEALDRAFTQIRHAICELMATLRGEQVT